MEDILEFEAEVHKVQTLADGGIRVTLNLSELAIDTAHDLMVIRQQGAVLHVRAIGVKPVLQEDNSHGKVQARSEWQPKG